jgi:hypothetical protein
MKKKMALRSIYMGLDQWKIFDEFSNKFDCSTNWLARKIIKEWIEKNTARPALKKMRARNKS